MEKKLFFILSKKYSIFALVINVFFRIHESLCEVEMWNESVQCKEDLDRCDTRAMNEGK